MRTFYRKWSEHPYENGEIPPPGHWQAGYWPMIFIKRGATRFLDPWGRPIDWLIKHPYGINWGRELQIVQRTLTTLTPEQIRIAKYWGTGELITKISSIILRFADIYRIGSPQLARILGYFHAAMNDVFVVTWYMKYMWDVARPNQYGLILPAVLATPLFPSYPSAHASVSGCAEVVLSYFFPQESPRIRSLLAQSTMSRLYAGVHFNADNEEGVVLGRQIGEIVVRVLRSRG
ncbi:vanadium-dependent haloperoxidase [Mesobacillus foraminis]|uniref:PAP2 superfamily protein n=1 Tax=Mesobacillus foraminis TaxID=279826 RepID=A0A4V2RDS7_9BACI|nr:vanadium-dependent haloperoxidase [Mesobacillus foraminis]TCN25980.1 PAP2 superfamily protein [Mesobacillus foraminis]